MIDRSQLLPLIDGDAVPAPPSLAESLKRFGHAGPLLVHGTRIVDGIKRWNLLTADERLTVPIVATPLESPFAARWLANAARVWNVIELALTLPRLSESERAAFMADRQIAPAPHLLRALAFLAAHRELWADVVRSALPISVWRDLGALDERLEEAVKLTLSEQGTVAEKRMLAGLLRQAYLKNRLPASLAGRNLTALLSELQRLVSPRREDMQQRYEEALRESHLPSRTEVTVDPVFEKPGVTVKLHLRRGETGKLHELAESLDGLFRRVPEL